MSLAKEDRDALAVEKIERLRKELEELGFRTTFFYRAPGAAKDRVGHLLVGETHDDVEAARAS